MKALKIIAISLFFLTSYFMLFTSSVEAQPLIDFPNYDVEIEVNEDSFMIVQETITHRFNGYSNGLRRDVTVDDPNLSAYCDANPNATCGGFNELFIIGAYDKDGNELTAKDRFQTYEVTTDYGEKYVRFEWQVWDNEYQNDTEVTWTVEYKLWGAIQWRDAGGISDSNSTKQVPYLYWNALPEQRSGDIEQSSVKIIFPDSVRVNPDNLITFTDYDSYYDVDRFENSLTLEIDPIRSSYGDYTVAYEFDDNELTQPGDIVIENNDMFGPTFLGSLFIDGIKVRNTPTGIIKGIPAGTHELSIEAFGFETYEDTINVSSGQNEFDSDANVSVELTRTTWSSILLYIGLLMGLIGCCLTPFGVVWVWWLYNKKGKDKKMPKTIIPEFKPPVGVHPYLLGSIKDEKVDKEDVVGTIIDLAYRGFIKIKEVKKGKKYEMIKRNDLRDKNDSLNEREQEIYDAVFNGKETMMTTSMRSHFPSKYTKVVSHIYGDMVKEGYFGSSPRVIRGMYAGFAIALVVLGVLGLGAVSFGFSILVNFPIAFSPAFGLIIAGVVLLPVSYFMPAKTVKGSKTYADILGFKMYLETAERFRLQKLGPEEFERWLSYAIVFKIEKEWAKKFEGIYEGQPEWFEGSSNTLFDAYLLSSLSRSFASAATTASTPISSSSSSTGGGWSGGGSFGGFSGGGGGGGSAGGW